MAGSPTFTIVLSRPTMNRLMQQTASMSMRRPEVAAMPVSAMAVLAMAVLAMAVLAMAAGSRLGALSDLPWATSTGACMAQTPRVVLAADEYRLLITRPAPGRGSGSSRMNLTR